MSLPKHIEDEKAIRAARMRAWRSKNREHWLRYCRKYKRNNPERYRVYRKRYLEKNPDHVLQLRKASNRRRRLKISQSNKSWYDRNKDYVIRKKSKYERERSSRDPAFKCKKLLKNRIIECLKRQRTIKYKRTLELIGCDRQFLVNWIESKFTNGMTWENHGNRGWHIDHIIPCASFDLSDPEQQKQCFHYTNLQPLWAKDNQSKSDKITT